MEGFCDWISISQTHDDYVQTPPTQVLQNFCSETGQINYCRNAPVQHRGSYDTSLRLQVNANRVSLSGNVGRFGRPDNLAGYTVDDVKRKANEILETIGLPLFTSGKFMHLANIKGDERTVYTGANISRIDITSNFTAGSHSRSFIHWLGRQTFGRSSTHSLADETIYMGGRAGKRSKYCQTKCYLKGPELYKHNKLKSEYVKDLSQWCEEQGIIRHETTFMARYLDKKNLKAWHNCTNENVMPRYQSELQKMTQRMQIDTRIEDLPAHYQATYYAHVNGADMTRLSRATFYRHRKVLLSVGVDIAKPASIRAINTKPTIIELKPATMPDFYREAI